MASLGIAANAVLRGTPLNSFHTRTQFSSGAREIRFSRSTPSLPDHHLVRSVTNSRNALRLRMTANAGQCADRNAETAAAKSMVKVESGHCTFVDSEIGALPAVLEGHGIAKIGEHWPDLLKRSGLADLQTREEAFAISDDITEANMERLVESLLHKQGQSIEDYRQRAIMFGEVAEFSSQGKAYKVEESEKSWTGGASDMARTMQVIVDVVLAEEGRSATDYKCRTQFFAKSAEVFPFTADGRSS